MRLLSRKPMTRLTRLAPSLARWMVLVALSSSFATYSAESADKSAEIRRLHDSGPTAAAMLRVDELLAAHPNDPRIRFLKGVMLADAKRNDEALVQFQKLTEDFPELAEPFNNLAALYAAAGDYRKARDALEQALLTNPNFAAAHENLGDVFAALARQSYARALQLTPNNVSVPRKLALLRELTAPKEQGGNAVPGASDSTTRSVATPVPK